MSKKRFHDAIKELIAINKENRASLFDKTNGLSNGNFAHQICTVHVDIGRRTGKTEFIKQNAKPEDLIIAGHHHVNTEYSGYRNAKTPREVMNMICPDYLNIYIDEPRIVFAELDKSSIYEKLARNVKEQTFILLGR